MFVHPIEGRSEPDDSSTIRTRPSPLLLVRNCRMRQVPGTCPGTTYTVLKVTINPATAKAKTDGPLMIKDRKLGICQDSQSCDSAAGADVVVLAPVDAMFLTVCAIAVYALGIFAAHRCARGAVALFCGCSGTSRRATWTGTRRTNRQSNPSR